MGRKIEMKKIENLTRCQVTYSKRRSSLIKKANELSMCCGIDVAFVAFSPSGRVSKYSNQNRIEDVIERYVNLPVEQRLSHIDNIEEKIEKLNKLSHINGDNSKMGYLDSQIENLELQVKKYSMELRMLETDLREYELVGPEQEPSLNQLTWYERNLDQSLQKVMARKDELENVPYSLSTFEKGEASSSANPITLMQHHNWISPYRLAPTSATVWPSTFVPMTTTIDTRLTPLPGIPSHLNVEMPLSLELYDGMGSGIQIPNPNPNPNPMNQLSDKVEQLNTWDYSGSFMDYTSSCINENPTNNIVLPGGALDDTQLIAPPPDAYVIPPPAQRYQEYPCYTNAFSQDSIGVASTNSQKADLCEWENWLLDENFNFVEQDPKI